MVKRASECDEIRPTPSIGGTVRYPFRDRDHDRQPLAHHIEERRVQAERHGERAEDGERHHEERHARHDGEVGDEAERRDALEVIDAEGGGGDAGDG
jgi:hypothetical protein